jgi:hypothetical protein
VHINLQASCKQNAHWINTQTGTPAVQELDEMAQWLKTHGAKMCIMVKRKMEMSS